MPYYFAYGSNMDGDLMRDRGINFIFRQRAKMIDKMLVFNKKADDGISSYANIIYADGDMLEGVLYYVLMSDIKKLDKVEGVPTHYSREKYGVFDSKSNMLDAFVYIANPDRTFKWTDRPWLYPTKQYLNYLLAGKEFLSKKYYEYLLHYQTCD